MGWREFISIPEWKISRLRVKADTGARSSALDVSSIEELDSRRVRFEIRLSRKKHSRRKVVESRISRRARVRSSSGQVQKRIFVTTRVRIGPIEKDVEFSLVCRKDMLCRALLGRSALEGHFLVDPRRRYVLDG